MPKKSFPKDSEIKMGISLELVINGSPSVIKLPTLKGKSKSCVYMITNKINNRIYIGQTTNIFNRMPRHFRDIISGEHSCKEIINDYLDFQRFVNVGAEPEDLFEFSIICYCRPSELTFYENILIRTLNPEYNFSKKPMTYVELEADIEESAF